MLSQYQTTTVSIDKYSIIVYNTSTKQIFLNEFGETDCKHRETLKLLMRKQIDGATLSSKTANHCYLQGNYRWQVVFCKVFTPYLQLLCLFRREKGTFLSIFPKGENYEQNRRCSNCCK